MKSQFQFALVAVLALSTLGSFRAEAAPNCSVQLSNNNWTAQIAFPNRTVTLLGWQHLGQKALIELSTAATKAYKSADCSEVQSLLDSARARFPKDVSESARIFSALSALNKSADIGVIGVEAAPSEMAQLNKINYTFNVVFTQIAQRCPDLQTRVSQFRILFPSPVAEFAQQKGNVVLDPNEDDALKAASGQAAIAMSKIQFLSGDLPQQAIQFLTTLSPTALSENTIETMSAQIASPEGKDKFLRFTAAHNAVFGRLDLRNQAIAKHIANETQSNYVAVIGALHVPGLAADLQALCKAGAK